MTMALFQKGGTIGLVNIRYLCQAARLTTTTKGA
jgi:hypothetical protein